MSEQIVKTNEEVIGILNNILNKIRNSYNNIRSEVEKTFNLDIVKSTANYCLDQFLLEIYEAINEELEQLKWVDALIDCENIPNDLLEIQQILFEAKDKILDEKMDIDKELDIKTEIDEITRTIYVQLPIFWGVEKIENIFNKFIEILNEIGVESF